MGFPHAACASHAPQGGAAPAEQPPSLNAFVPRGDYDQLQRQHQALNNRVANMEQAALAEKVAQALAQAVQAGKVAPATQEYHRAQCLQPGGLERFQAFCQAAPTLAPQDLVAAGAPGAGSSGQAAGGLTAAQVALCSRLGVSNVFQRNEYWYGVDSRCGVGFGLWQLAYGSKQALDATAYAAARAALLGMKNRGRPMGVMPNLLVVPPTLEGAARDILKVQLTSGGESNKWYNSAEVLVTPWLA